MEQIIVDVLEYDAKYRESVRENTELVGLFRFEELNLQDWDYSLPTLKSDQELTKQNIEYLKQFKETFYEKIPFKITMDNVIFAGGAICHILQKHNHNPKDIDIFIYGLSETEANAKVNTLIEDLYERYKNYLVAKAKKDRYGYRKEIDFTYVRNNNCVTVIFGTWVFQIILRTYSSISEILYGFDIGASAVGFNGETVYYTYLSKFSHEYGCNIIDSTRRSTTYEQRLVKYFKRGFEIIMPDMSLKNLSRKNSKYGLSDICEMPYLTFSYKKFNAYLLMTVNKRLFLVIKN